MAMEKTMVYNAAYLELSKIPVFKSLGVGCCLMTVAFISSDMWYDETSIFNAAWGKLGKLIKISGFPWQLYLDHATFQIMNGLPYLDIVGQ